jgi:hypothetical protein
MPTLTIGENKISVGDDFMKMSPEQQHATVEEIAKALPNVPKAEPKESGFASSAKEMIGNIPASAARMVGDIANTVAHPLDTLGRIGEVAAGATQKAAHAVGADLGSEGIPQADAVGKFFKDRYGSMDAVKKTIIDDPVGFAADLSTVLSGGGAAAARAPGIVGEVGRATSTVARAVDPLSAAGKAATMAGKGAAEVIGGVGTQTGAESIRQAARAGAEGGESGRAFQESMRGQTPMEDVVADARKALGSIRQERGKTYRDGMKDIGADTAVLDFDKVDKALADVSQVKTYKGQVISPKTQGIRGEIGDAIRDWKMLDPAEYHTAEGLDALKQKIGDIRDSTQHGTPERLVADRAYQSIRQTIVDQAPKYAKVMKGYEEASNQIREIERTLSLNPNASVDTSLRKLQSVLRDNVNTNYGQRKQLAEYLVSHGAPNLMEKLAGQALSSWAPRGLGKMVGAEILAAGAGAAGAGATGAGLGAMSVLPLMSPRLMGEAAYYTGKAAANIPARATTRSAFQLGRQDDNLSSVGRSNLEQ